MIFVGDDWSEQHHDIEIHNEAGGRLGRKRLPEGIAGIAELHALVGEHLPADHVPDRPHVLGGPEAVDLHEPFLVRLDADAFVGATAPEPLVRARELMPRATFLLPGVGAQGGRVEDLRPAFAPGAHGGLVTASRSIPCDSSC